MARISVSDTRSSSGRSELGRAVTALAVIAAHVALFFVMSRSTGHLAEVVDTIFVTLPITPEDRPQEPALVQKPPSAPAAEHVPRHAFAAREVATVPPRVEDSSRTEAAITGEKVATPASPALEPAPPVDWHAAATASADALARRDSIESNRRSLAGPKQDPSSISHQTSECPLERCEPDWDTNLGIFESQHSKAGRIERVPDNLQNVPGLVQNVPQGEVIRWINKWCYLTLVTADPYHKNMLRCAYPVGKTKAHSDRFNNIRGNPPPESRDTDAP